MIAIILTVWVAVFALAILVAAAYRAGPSKPVRQRLDALLGDSVPVPLEAAPANIRRNEQICGSAWLNRWMVRFNLTASMRLLLYQADVKTAPETLLLVALAGWAAIACIIYARTRALLPAVLLAAGFVPVPLIRLFRKRAKRLAKFEQQLPEALDMLVGALQIGHSLIMAIGSLGQHASEPVAGEFRKLFDEQNFGLDLRTAMTNLTTRVPLQDVRIFVAAALIQKESGGNLAEVLAKVALTTRERFRLKKQIMVHTAQGRLTGWVLSLLPVVLGFGMYLVNPEGMSILWTTPAGLKMLYAATAMIVVGWLIIRKIVRIRV